MPQAKAMLNDLHSLTTPRSILAICFAPAGLWIALLLGMGSRPLRGADAAQPGRLVLLCSDEVRRLGFHHQSATALAQIEGSRLIDPTQAEAFARQFDPDTWSQPSRLAERARLGQATSADALILLSTFGAPTDRRLSLVVCDGRTGLPLRRELLEYDQKGAYEIADRVREVVVDAHNAYPAGVTQVVSLGFLAGKDLPSDFDSLPAAFTQLLRECLLALPGVAVVEAAEARCFSESHTAADQAEPLIPLFVNGEFQFAAPPGAAVDASQVSFTLRIARPPLSAESTQHQPAAMRLEKAADFLAAEVPSEILRLGGRSAPAPSAAQQFDRLIAHADTLSSLGDFERSAVLREAALLIQPAATEQRLKLIDDYREISAAGVLTIDAYAAVDFTHTPNLRTIKRGADAYIARFAHVAFLVRQRSVSPGQAIQLADQAINHTVRGSLVTGVVEGRLHVLGETDLFAAEQAKERFILQVMPELRVWIEQTPVRERREFARSWERALIEGTLTRHDRTYRTKEELEFIHRVLTEILPSGTASNPVVERFFSEQGKRYNGTPAGVPAATDADWLNFLTALEHSPNPTALRYAKYGRANYKPGGAPDWAQPRPAGAAQSVAGPPQRRAFSGPGTWSVRQGVTAYGIGFEGLNLKIRGLDGQTISAAGIRYRVGHAWFGPAEVIACGPGLDVWRYPGAILFMRQPGVLDEIFVDDTAEFENVCWDGRAVWIATRRAGVWVVKPDGSLLARFNDAAGLPPAEEGLVLQPLARGRVLAAGSYGPRHRGWCAFLECGEGGHNTVRIFHVARQVPRIGDHDEEVEQNPALGFSPCWAHDYQTKDGSRRILIGRDGHGHHRPLEIDPVTATVSIFARRLQLSAPLAHSRSYFSQLGYLLEGSGQGLILYPPPGEHFSRGREFRQLCRSGLASENPLFLIDGWLYATGGSWHRIDPRTWTSERLDSENQKPWWQDSARYHLAMSSHYGLLAWDDGVFCRITGAAPRAARAPTGPSSPSTGSAVSEGLKLFFNPNDFGRGVTLLDFENQGPEHGEVRDIDQVRFSLVEHDTLNPTGAAPTLGVFPPAAAPREFPPADGAAALCNVSGYAANIDLEIKFPGLLDRVGFELRSGAAQNDARELTVEFYRGPGASLLGTATIRIRGADHFFFYGIESATRFDRIVIRQLPADQFELDNLRFETAAK